MRPYWVYDRWGAQIDAIASPVSARSVDVLDGLSTLELEVPGTPIAKGDRVLRLDRYGEWREYVATQVEHRHEGGVTSIATLEDSRVELETDYLVEVEPGSVGASRALAAALSESRWAVGRVTAVGTRQMGFYHVSASEALDEIAEAYDAEVASSITVSGTGVSGRAVDLLDQMGEDRGVLLSYGVNVSAVERVVGSEPVYTALYGYGASVETEGGGHSRKLTFGSVNGGRDWVGDEAARELYGVPDGSGGKRHAFGDVEFSDCEDAGELLSLTRRQLQTSCQPTVSYTVSVAYLDADRTPAVGDTVHVRDPELGERLRTRVVRIEGDDVTGADTRVTLGTRRRTLTAQIKRTQAAAETAQSTAETAQYGVDELGSRSKDWDSTTDIVDTAPGEWLQKVMDRINEEMDAAKTYKFTSFDKGDIWANGPLTADGKPTGSTSAAIALNGLGLRISSEVRNGDFVWTTFGTGEGFTASVINVGTLRCGDNYINMDTGELRLALTAKVGSGNDSLSGYVTNAANSAATAAANTAKNQAIQQAVAQADQNTQDYLDDYVQIGSFDSYLTMRNTFNALTHNGADKGFYISGNQVFVNADYVRTGVIESTNGRSVWDLDNGYFETGSSGYTGGQFHGINTRIASGQYAVKMDQTNIGTISSYSSGSVHPFGIVAFTDLVFACPRNVGVSYSGTTTGSLTYTATMREAGMNLVASASKSGTSVTFDNWQARFMHGMLISLTDAANTTFTIGSTTTTRLIASVDPVSELDVGGAIQVEEVLTEGQLMDAVGRGSIVWAEDDEGGPGYPVYTGEEWTGDVPVQEASEPLEVPTTEYLEAQVALIQEEIAAIAASAGDAGLARRISAAREASASADVPTINIAAKGVTHGEPL